ncbi:MAG: hypothetical protein DRI36_04590 [Caldiserica bacterium]|nr:MAG: hypothetical protein DRI36_04590 [Caldisericota bacterium]
MYSAKKLLSDKDIKISVKFLLVGSGKERRKMLKLIKRLNLERNVIVGEHLAYDKIPYLFNLGDIFVLPSIPTRYWQEQFGYVLIEAMASGLPVVSTLTGAIPEVVSDSGILVPPGDYSLLYKSIKSLIENSNLRKELGKRARRRVEDNFSAKQVGEKLQKICLNLLDK